jgi:hypothetical protein
MGLWDHIDVLLVQEANTDLEHGISEETATRHLNEFRKWIKENKEEIRKTEPEFVDMVIGD